MRAWIALPLLAVPVAVLGMRRASPSPVRPIAVAASAAAPESEIDPTPGEAASEERRVPEDTSRFEPLEPPPRELVVQLVLGDSEEPVRDAEVFALEHDDYEWNNTPEGGCTPVPDVEALARSQGRRLECDAEGRVHLGMPERVVFLCARKGELFGAGQFDATDAPEDALSLAPAHDCRVRVVSTGGAPLSRIPIVLGRLGGRLGDIWWRATTDSDGEVCVPNVQWLVEAFGDRDHSWFIAVEEVSSSPPLRSFAGADPIPRELELKLPSACALSIEMQASDGTPVPLRGTVELYGIHGHGRKLGVQFGTKVWPQVALVGGRALVPRAEPGATFSAGFELEGGFEFDEPLRVPDLDSAEVVLRLPAKARVLLFRAVDALGAPLAGCRLQWIADEQVEVRTDELGRGALVIDREEPLPDEDNPGARPQRVVLRLDDGATHLSSAAFDISALPSGSVLDLGTLRLEPLQTLVRGRIVDGDGAPLARARVELQHVQLVNGEEECADLVNCGEQETGSDGRFALHGTCPGGRLRLLVERDGYALAEGVQPPVFECGESPEIELVLERCGILRASVLADAPLGRSLSWILTGPGGEEREILYAYQGPGEVENEFWWLRPGRYRIELVTGNPLDAPLAAFDDVLVQPGSRTLDPRLLRVPLHGLGSQEGGPAERGPELPKISIEVADAAGQRIEEGLYITWGGCGWGRSNFSGGGFEFSADMNGRRFGLWAPGQSYWEGRCPESGERIVLQPALRASVHVDVPDVLRRAGALVYVDVLEREEDETDRWLPDLADSAELDERGEVRIEFPGPCRMRLGLHVLLSDPSGVQRRADVEFEEGAEPWFRVVEAPGEQRFELAPPAAAWAALAAALGVSR